MGFIRIEWAAVAAALFSTAIVLLASKHKMSYTRQQLKNLAAFLLMIQYSEGTIGPNAYRTLYGGELFSDYSRHPNLAIRKYGITSTAAGAYQFLYKVWEELRLQLRLPDFSPASQNRAAIELIRRRKALEDVLAGRFSQAIYKCRKTWASLPGAGYGQSERSMASLASVFQKAGGKINTA